VEEYSEETYGERIAHLYDEWYGNYEAATVEALVELAGGGRVLELGIGTGRIALPLQEEGVEVHGIDASKAMLARLQVKPGGERIPTTIGNFADVDIEGEFSLIFVLFNTFFALLTQDEQVRCFANVARHLSKDGKFVMETFVPDMTRFDSGQSVRAIDVGLDGVKMDVSELDFMNQRIKSQHVVISQDAVTLYPVKLRFAWPSELDLMAQLAGLRLEDRWSNWERAPFTSESTKHISVYTRSG
jgi:SAM-dependent methyltransferase